MKCAVCLSQPTTEDRLLDRDWPPDALTTIDGTAVCAVHAALMAPPSWRLL